MSYCINPDCQRPQNDDAADFCLNCAAPLRLQERYRILKPIGQGGFGRTFLAADEHNPRQQRCVVKQLFPQQWGNRQKASELFRQEAEQLSRLGKHAKIPQLLAYFEQDNRQYLVQEFIEGRTLAQELAEDGPFNEAQIRQLLQSLLPVLQLLHNHRLIHRDIKPENIIRRSTREPFEQGSQFQSSQSPRSQTVSNDDLVLVDFGAAKLTSSTLLGNTGTVIGSAAYTAPEQARGKAIFASDLYSLAVTCVHLLTQVSPFDLVDSAEDSWVWRHYLRQPVGHQLGQVLDRMLEPATKRRYPTATAVLADLNNRSRPAEPMSKKGLVKLGFAASSAMLLTLGGVWFFMAPHLGFRTQASRSQYQSSRSVYERSAYERMEDKPAVQWVSNPTTPGLHAQSTDGKAQVFPLQNTEVMARVAGNVSRVEVTQTFTNPYSDPLEAIYVFPLPDEAAVDDMEIVVGDRVIRGTIQKRQKAQQIYQEAKRAGKTAALLEQERANIFTQSLANIKPGETIKVTIRYSDPLKFEQGDYEFVFPTVVGPRYIPKSGVKDAARISPILAEGGKQSEVLAGGSSSASPGHDIGITVEIDAGVPVMDVRSPSHRILTSRNNGRVRVQLAATDRLPNKDLILRYQVADSKLQSTVLTQADDRGGHFATYLIPALQYQADEIVPKDVVFLIDTSGSQHGAPMEQSKQLMRRFIQGLNPYDTFAIVNFSDRTAQLSSEPLQNTPKNRDRALAYINSLRADGGTELLNGIQTVLQFPPAPEGRLRSIVLLTDGYIGNDEEIVGRVKQQLKSGNRLYSFGVGSSVNRFLVNRLAEVGRGTATVVRHDQAIDAVVETFLQRVNNPVLTNVQVTWTGAGQKPELYPRQAPDLFANQPLVVLGRKTDRRSGSLKVTGTVAGGERYEQTFRIGFDGSQANGGGEGNGAIAQLWGRARIKDLMTQSFGNPSSDHINTITDTALAYRLLSKYTAFVAVTEAVRVEPGTDKTAQVPVAQPQGMTNLNGERIPEPSQVLAILLLGLYLLWRKRRCLSD